MNLDRVYLRPAVAHLQGAGASRSNDPLDYAWFDAIALIEEEAEGMSAEVNAQRGLARARANYNRRGGIG